MFKDIFKTSTFRQSQITIVATLVNGALGLLFYILIARFLGPADFGLLAVSIAFMTLVADIVDFGTNTGLIRHVGASITQEKEKAWKFLKLSLEFKIIIWLLTFTVGFLMVPFIAEGIFHKRELEWPLRLVLFGVGGALFFSFATSSLQTMQKYFVWSVVNISTNLLRVVVILFLFYSGMLGLSNGLISYIALPFFGFFLALVFLPTKQILSVKNEAGVARQLFKYNAWVAAFTVIAALSSRLDIFLNARLLSNFEVGIYGSANQLVQVVPQLVVAIGAVVTPKFASFTDNKTMMTYFKKLQLFVGGLAVLGIASIPVSVYLIPKVFGLQYQEATAPFIVLFLAMLIFLISLPVHSSIIFYFGKPQVFVWISIGHLLIISLLGYFLILNYGIMGAAFTVLTGNIFNFIAPLLWLFKLRK